MAAVHESLRRLLDTSQATQQQCMTLLELVEQEDGEYEPQQRRLHAYLAQLRGLNRSAVLQVRETKQRTAEARQEMDRLHLQLQNLHYEERHLHGEIAACETYDHLYQQLQMAPLDEFLATQPDHQSDDEKALTVARIEHERAERVALEQQRQTLQQQKTLLTAENKRRKDELAALDQELEKYIDAANPIQELFEKHSAD